MKLKQEEDREGGRALLPFSVYLSGGAVAFTLLGVTLGMLFSSGMLDGYFSSLPFVVFFYAVVGLGSGFLLRRMLTSSSKRSLALVQLLSLGRLVLVVVVTALGIWLLPSHRLSFVFLSLICYIVAMLVSLLSVIRR